MQKSFILLKLSFLNTVEIYFWFFDFLKSNCKTNLFFSLLIYYNAQRLSFDFIFINNEFISSNIFHMQFNHIFFYNILIIYQDKDKSFFLFQIIKYQSWTSGESFWRLETTYNPMLEIKPLFRIMFLVGIFNQVIESQMFHLWIYDKQNAL